MNQIMSKEDLKAFAVTIKIGLVATIDDLGDPHITVLSTLSGKDEKTLMFGKFVVAQSTSGSPAGGGSTTTGGRVR